jgi:hypothetical protein
MRDDRGVLLLLANAGMELSWLSAWASFLVMSIADRPFPMIGAIGAFVLGTALTLAVRGMGLRVISVLGTMILGFSLAASSIVHTFYYLERPYFDKAWLFDLLVRDRGPMAWLILVIILILALSFWLGGVTLAGRSKAYLSISSRFDLGVAAFFLLFLIKLLVRVKGGIELKNPLPEFMLFAFFVFSLLAIGLARNRSPVQRDFLGGYEGVGVLVSFTVVILALGAGLVLLFMPCLRSAAETGYEALKTAGAPLGPILARILLFIFLGARARQEPGGQSLQRNGTEVVSPGERGWWSDLIQEVLTWGFLGLGFLIGIVLCALGVWYLVRWLFSKTSRDDSRRVPWHRSLSWLGRLWGAMSLCFLSGVRRFQGYRDAVEFYRALMRWGRRSGIPRLLSETPAEYGLRLQGRFPSLAGEIRGIVEALNLSVYGELTPTARQMAQVRLAWKSLHSPRYWAIRLRSRWWPRSSSAWPPPPPGASSGGSSLPRTWANRF